MVAHFYIEVPFWPCLSWRVRWRGGGGLPPPVIRNLSKDLQPIETSKPMKLVRGALYVNKNIVLSSRSFFVLVLKPSTVSSLLKCSYMDSIVVSLFMYRQRLITEFSTSTCTVCMNQAQFAAFFL